MSQDLSPPRRPRGGDLSPPRRRPNSEDLSPPRRDRHSNQNLSPPRKRHDSDDDLSPPRKRHDSNVDISPPRRRRRHDSDDDLSPPRKRTQRHDSDDDLSPPRKGTSSRSAKDLSPPRRRRRHDSDDDLSPPRKRTQRHDSDDDLSPPRRNAPPRRSRDLSPPRKRRETSSKDRTRSSDRPTSSGGLQTRWELETIEEERRRSEREKFRSSDAEGLGKGAATVYRDKEGKALTINDIRRMEEQKAEEEEVKMEWGVGLVQKKEKEDRRAELEALKDKPFARSVDDQDLNEMWRDTDRWGDPMAHLVTKKRKNEKKKLVGNIELAKVTSERRWSGPAPLNRFNIRPGNLWDGVDRSNGFEKKYLSREANKKAKEEQAYLFEVEDF